jgi:tetratricopeptide (TPR) repeat protein
MKKTLIGILGLCICFSGLSQEKKSAALLKELAENGCKCIDSINTYNKTKEEISTELSTCIDRQANAYQLGSKFMDIDLSKQGATQKTINISFNANKNSEEYKRYYYELERYMMTNCKSMKPKMGASDLENYFSVSKNPEAQKIYSKGIKESEKGNYEKAITCFKKALDVDSLFAFAWDNMGLCYRKLSKYDEAIYAYSRSLNLDPLGQMPLLNMAVAYKYQKEYNKAIAAYERLAELDPNNPEVFYGIGQIYSEGLNDPENALQNMCKAYTLYVKQKSPYRTDAEKMIGIIYAEMKKQGKEERFEAILKENKISSTSEN